MIEELRSIARPGLRQALGWVGFRVDDIYGANIGKLEDVWVDPANGEPRWLLVRSGRFGGRHTLIPFDDATAGAGHIWVPFERDAVRHATQVDPSEPLPRKLDAHLRAHYDEARASVASTPADTAAPRASAAAPPVRLERVREERHRDGEETPVDVVDAVVRIDGIGELDGRPVEISLEGTFTGTIRPRAQVRRSGRRQAAAR